MVGADAVADSTEQTGSHGDFQNTSLFAGSCPVGP